MTAPYSAGFYQYWRTEYASGTRITPEKLCKDYDIAAPGALVCCTSVAYTAAGRFLPDAGLNESRYAAAPDNNHSNSSHRGKMQCNGFRLF
jgi:hypothetical protein